MKKIPLLLLCFVMLAAFSTDPTKTINELNEFLGVELEFEETTSTYFQTDIEYPVLESDTVKLSLTPNGEVEDIEIDLADKATVLKVVDYYGIDIVNDDRFWEVLGNEGICYDRYITFIDNTYIEFSEYIPLSEHSGKFVIRINFNPSKFSDLYGFQSLRMSHFGCSP